MKRIFVDAGHLIALINPRDQLHQRSTQFDSSSEALELFTTEEVLTEVLNFYCESGQYMRGLAAALVREILLNVRFSVLERTESSFLDALEFYESRPDKGHSLTDCISMNVCRSLKITEILTNDEHFKQEGFSILL